MKQTTKQENNIMSLDNTISTPLFQQLADKLRSAIDRGEYLPGSRLPTEKELCEQYSVSRVTVRKALDELSRDEFLVRKPGKGTFVAEKKIQRKLEGVLSFTEMCRMMGYQPGAKTVKIALEQPTEKERAQLGLKKEEQMLVVERLRLADGRPMLLETSKFSERFFFLFNADLNNASLFDEVRKQTGIVFTKSEKILEIVFANHQEAKYLDISKGYPLLSIKSVVEDESGENHYLSRLLCIADKFKLMV